MGARLHRAAEQERAVQEGRRPAQRPRPDPAHLLQARLRTRSTPPTCAAGSAGWASTRSARPGFDGGKTAMLEEEELDDEFFMMRVRSDGKLLPAATVRALGEIGADFARDTADVTDRENIQYHWIRIEDVPAIWERLDAAGLDTHRGVRRLAAAVPRLAGRRRRRRRDHRRHLGAGRDQAPRHRQPGLLEPPAQVQDRADRPPEPRRLPRDQRHRLRRHRPPRARPRLRRLGRRRPVHQPDAGPEARRLGPDSTTSPTSGRASPRSSATTATAGCARAPG